MSAMKDTCTEAFLGGSPRLVEPMYYCELQTDQEYYGNVYNELSKRRAVIISEDLHEISNVFIIKAYLPVV
jgi:translation elongation factor EF-G